MTELLKYFLPMLTAVLSFAAGYGAPSADMKSYSFDVKPFTILKIQDNVNVVYHHQSGTHPHIEYKSDPDFEDAFIFSNSGETLRIQVTTEDVDKPGLPTIHIYSDNVKKFENYSDLNLTVDDPIPAAELSFYLIGNGSINVHHITTAKLNARVTAGNGTITLSGDCVKAEFRMAGAGTINARQLNVRRLECKILGGGDIYCHPDQFLKVLGIGSTKIFYSGNPEIKHSGGGKLIPLNATTE